MTQRGLIVVFGPPKSGKTPVARALAQHLDVNWVSVGAIAAVLKHAAGLPSDRTYTFDDLAPFVSTYLASSQETNSVVVIDGDLIEPRHLAGLDRTFSVLAAICLYNTNPRKRRAGSPSRRLNAADSAQIKTTSNVYCEQSSALGVFAIDTSGQSDGSRIYGALRLIKRQCAGDGYLLSK